jgi:hypothetical protein
MQGSPVVALTNQDRGIVRSFFQRNGAIDHPVGSVSHT